MRNTLIILFACGFLTSCKKAAPGFDPAKIVALEKTALDRWGRGDPQGYLEIYTPDITYFDPALVKRADGIKAMTEYLDPITGKIRVDRYEMIDTKVQQLADAAVLSYQLISHAVLPDGSRVTIRWNSTKVYRLVGSDWKLLHDHWSFTKPELKNPIAGTV